MESWCFSGAPSPLVVVCDPSTLLHTTVLSVMDVAGLWPGSPWTGLWFWSLPWWMWPWCCPPCTGVCFWFLETYPGRAACSASSALLTNSSLSVWTNCSVCCKERGRKRDWKKDRYWKFLWGRHHKLKFKRWKTRRDRVSERDREGLSHCWGVWVEENTGRSELGRTIYRGTEEKQGKRTLSFTI